MSLYCFTASDKKIPSFSIGIEDQGYRIIIEDEKHYLNLYEEEQNCYTKAYTEKPFIMGLDIGLDFSTVANDLLLYLQEVMNDTDSLEMWLTWMKEVGEIEKVAKHIDSLTIDDLFWIWGEKEYTHPKCLKVFKWKRGKK